MWLRRLSVLSVVLLSLGSVVALANPNPLSSQIAQNLGGQQRQNQGRQRLMQELNLTQEQKQQLQTIHSQYKDQISQRRQTLRQVTQELGELMAGTAPADQVRTKHQEVQGLRQQLEHLHFESMLATREVLDAGQRQRFAQLMEQRHQDFRERPENSRGQER